MSDHRLRIPELGYRNLSVVGGSWSYHFLVYSVIQNKYGDVLRTENVWYGMVPFHV